MKGRRSDELAVFAEEAARKTELAEQEWELASPTEATATALLAINANLERVAILLELLIERES